MLASPSIRDLAITYTIDWDDPGPFDSQLNDHHAFINFAEVLMYVPNQRGEDTEVKLVDLPEGWKTIVELPAGHDPNSYTATSYDRLVDAPVEAGNFQEFEFDNQGAHFRVVVDAKDWNKGKLEDGLRRLTGYEVSLMGGPPFQEYTFFFHIGPYLEVGGGGMEHANCTAIGAGNVDSAVQIAAHEFFHAWNVKRIRPQTLEPVDYTREQFTRALWFAEGVTSTYASYVLERTAIWSKGEFYQDLGTQIQFLQSRPARLWQSVEESSLDTWFDKYDAYALPDRSISYYNKGQILGVMLDLAIRDATDNHKSLDDVLRRMNEEYARQGKLYDDSEGIRRVVEKVAGKSFRDFFDHYVSGTQEIPYGDFLADAGLALNVDILKRADLGFSPGRGPGGVAVMSVSSGSAAEMAGIREGDVILRINGHDIPQGRGGLLAGLSPGDTVAFRINRDGRELDISYVLGTREDNRYSIEELSEVTDRQRRIREGLLRGTTD
jgi:predicted metalloprotease with PDZ domain